MIPFILFVFFISLGSGFFGWNLSFLIHLISGT